MILLDNNELIQSNCSDSDLWETPPEVLTLIRSWGFTLIHDLCCSHTNCVVPEQIFFDDIFTVDIPSLKTICNRVKSLHRLRENVSQYESFSLFMNPPYSKKAGGMFKFVKQAIKIATDVQLPVVMVLKCDTSTRMFHYLYENDKCFIHFCKGRVKFLRDGKPGKNCANFATMIVTFDPREKG